MADQEQSQSEEQRESNNHFSDHKTDVCSNSSVSSSYENKNSTEPNGLGNHEHKSVSNHEDHEDSMMEDVQNHSQNSAYGETPEKLAVKNTSTDFGGMKKDDSGIVLEQTFLQTSASKSDLDISEVSVNSDSESISVTDSGKQSDLDSVSIGFSESAPGTQESAGSQIVKIDMFAEDDVYNGEKPEIANSNSVNNTSKDSTKTNSTPNSDLLLLKPDDKTEDHIGESDSRSKAETNDPMVQEHIDTSDSDVVTGSYDVSGPSASNDMEADEDDDDDEEKLSRVFLRRRLRRRISSSSDNSDADEAHHSGSSKESSDAEMETNEEPDPLKQNWFAIPELRRREYGYSSGKSMSNFRYHVSSSVHLVQRLKLQYKMQKHSGCVNALHFNQAGTRIASGSDDLNVVIWDWARNKPAMKFDSGHRSNVFQTKFMPYSGDCHLVTCARDGQVRLAELSATGRCKATKRLAQHRGAAHKLSLEHDSTHTFLSCGEDAVTYEIDLRQDKPNKLSVTKEKDKKVALYSIHSNPSNSYEFCVGGRDHYIRIYDKRKIASDENDGILKKYCPHHLLNGENIKANVTCAVYNYNGTEVLGTYNDEDIYLFDNSHSDGAEYIHRYEGHRNNATVKGVNFYGPCSEYVVSGSDCGHVFLWDKETERIVQYFEADDGGVVNVLEPHPNGPILATSGLDHDVKIWAPTAEEPTDLQKLKQTTKKNRKERERERSNEPDIDGQMLWFLMHHLRRTARRRARQEGEDVSSSSNSSESSSQEESDEEEGSMNERMGRMQCAPQ